MQQFLSSPSAQAVIWLAALTILIIIGFYVVQKFRGHTDEDRPTSSELMTNFREMHHEGAISDVEYRKLKTVLGAKLQDELKDTGEEG